MPRLRFLGGVLLALLGLYVAAWVIAAPVLYLKGGLVVQLLFPYVLVDLFFHPWRIGDYLS